jgi:hypothetical protein
VPPFLGGRGGWKRVAWRRERWAGNGGTKAVGAGKVAAAAVRRQSARPGRRCSDRVTDRWVPRGFQFFKFTKIGSSIKKSKWVPYLASKNPNFCM